MAEDITHYFKQVSKFDVSKLPLDILQSTVNAVENELKSMEITSSSSSETTPSAGNNRGVYLKISAKDRAMIGEYASKNGVAAAIHHFKQTGQFLSLKETSVRGWRDAYCKELAIQSRKRPGSSISIVELPLKRRGRPLLLGEEMEREVQSFIKSNRELGTAVSTAVVMATARGVVISHDSNLLKMVVILTSQRTGLSDCFRG